jgi:hypothetical protein
LFTLSVYISLLFYNPVQHVDALSAVWKPRLKTVLRSRCPSSSGVQRSSEVWIRGGSRD